MRTTPVFPGWVNRSSSERGVHLVGQVMLSECPRCGGYATGGGLRVIRASVLEGVDDLLQLGGESCELLLARNDSVTANVVSWAAVATGGCSRQWVRYCYCFRRRFLFVLW